MLCSASLCQALKNEINGCWQEWAEREKAADAREAQLKSRSRELLELQEKLDEDSRALKSRRDGASSDLEEVLP